MDHVKPRLKDFRKLVTADEIVLIQEAGVEITLPDPDGQVRALLNLLDGSRTIKQATYLIMARWPQVTPADVAEAVADLGAAGLLEDAAAQTRLSPWQQNRYASNLAFFGTFAGLETSCYDFQEALRSAHVVLLGVGGVGSTLLYNLTALGVGHITIVDCDRVELKNLTRQFLYSEADVGLPKLDRAVARAQAFNSEVRITAVERWVSGPADIAPLLPGADLVLSVIDKPDEVQDWVNQACVAAGVPFIAGGIQVAHGIYYSVAPGRSGCLACWTTTMEQSLDTSALAATRPPRVNRVIGPAASMVGALIGLEAVRYLTGFAPPVSAGKLWLTDFATGQVAPGYEWPRVPGCPVCGTGLAEAVAAPVENPVAVGV